MYLDTNNPKSHKQHTKRVNMLCFNIGRDKLGEKKTT